MADPRFFHVSGSFKLAQLALIAEASLSEGTDPEKLFTDVQPLTSAGPDHISFLDNKGYLQEFSKTRAGACIIDPSFAANAPPGIALLFTKKPYHAYARIAHHFYPNVAAKPISRSHPLISANAIIANTVCIEPGAVVGEKAEIGNNTRIGANSTIGPGVRIGDDCKIDGNVTLQYCLLGNQVIVHAGARIGQDGFGFALGKESHLKVPQLGRVVIGDNVEIGANTTIDRGTGPDTIIGSGCKIDNLVQIAHNVCLGNGCVIVSQVGISGSTELGNYVMAGGQAGLTGHLKIGDGAQIAAQSGVMRNIGTGEKVGGSPAKPLRNWLKEVAAIERFVSKRKAC